jgi:hypothetical protein
MRTIFTIVASRAKTHVHINFHASPVLAHRRRARLRSARSEERRETGSPFVRLLLFVTRQNVPGALGRHASVAGLVTDDWAKELQGARALRIS